MNKDFLKSILIGLFLVLIFAGCVPATKETKPDEESRAPAQGKVAPPKKYKDIDLFTHKVTWEGESLSIIAKWYTGKLGNWKALAEANPHLDPDHIHIGDKIAIPKTLMKTDKSLPKSFVTRYRAEQEKESASEPGEEQEEETPTLFGPKEYTK